MGALSDVKEYSIQEEDVGFDVQVLAPGKAEIEEEFGKTLIFDEFLLVFFSSLFILLTNIR